MEAVLILGCAGYTNSNIIFCKSIENIILDFETIKHTANYEELIKYLDYIKLFNGPCLRANVISNCLYKIYELGYFKEVFYKNICAFCQQHARCSTSLEIKIKGD